MQKAILVTTIAILVSILAMLTVFHFNPSDTKQALDSVMRGQASLISRFADESEQKISLVRISNSGVSTYGLSPNKKDVVFFNNEGVFEIAGFDAISKFKGDGPFAENIADGVWSSSKMESIVTVIESDGVKKLLYNYRDGVVKSLSQNIQNVDFSADGERVVYSFFDSNIYEGNISISRPDGTNFVNIFKTRLSNIKITWVRDDLITFYKKSTDKKELIDLFQINNKGEGFGKILSGKLLLKVLWAPDGKSLVYSTTVNDEEKLYYKFIESGADKYLDLKTSAENCSWSRTNINLVCFEDGVFYRVSVVDNAKNKIYELRDENKIENIKLSPLEDYLLFVNRNDGQLYSLFLK